jgi:hypothetical protein
MTPDPFFISCILGRCDSLRAEMYVRSELPAGVYPSGAAVAGTLTGPDCRHAITLPVTAKLAAVPGSPAEPAAATATSVVARAILTEPSYWTPELPNLYRLEARLEAGGRELAAWRRPVGLRRLGVRGRSLWLDGRRYVPRGLMAPAEQIDLAAFRAAAVAAVVPDPSEAFLTRADVEGIAVLGLLTDEAGHALDVEAATAAVLRWAWHPAVLVAVVPRGVSAAAAGEIATATRSRRGTLLVAWEADGPLPPPAVPAGIDLLVVTLPAGEVPHAAWRTEPPAVPLVARAKRGRESFLQSTLPGEAGLGRAACGGREMTPDPFLPSRRPCDSLQAALAAWGTAGGAAAAPDWAGYVTA